MKRIITLILTLTLVLSLATSSVFAASSVNVKANGSTVNFVDANALIKDGRTLVPVRGVFEALGCKVSWDQPSKTASITYKGNTLKISVGSSDLWLNNKKLNERLDVPAQLIESRTYVPLRYPAQTLGFNVEWENASKTVYVTGKGLKSTLANTEAENIFKMIGTNKSTAGEWFKSNLNIISSLNSSLNELKSAHAKVDAIYSGGFLIIDCVNIASGITKALEKGSAEMAEAIVDAQKTMLSYAETETLSVQDYFTGLGESSFYSSIDLSEYLLDMHIRRIERGYFSYDDSVAYATCYYMLMANRQTISTAVELLLEKSPAGVLDSVLLTTKKFAFTFMPNSLSGDIENLLDLNSDVIRRYYTSINQYKSKLQTILY